MCRISELDTIFTCSIGALAAEAALIARYKAEAEKEADEFVKKCAQKHAQKRHRDDVKTAIYMAANGLKRSPEAQNELGFSKSQFNKRIRLIKEGEKKMVKVCVRCTCCSKIILWFSHQLSDVSCECDEIVC